MLYIDNEIYKIVKNEPYEFSQNIGCHFEEKQICYVTDKNGVLYVTTNPYWNIILPIKNTDRIRGFQFDLQYERNQEADFRSIYKASQGNYNQQAYYRVYVQFRHHYFYNFFSRWLTFGTVYCACKYFFDHLYPEGYRYSDKTLHVDFRAGAEALNFIKRSFGKKSTRQYVDSDYCKRNYANLRDLKYLGE